jgi:hypothetical protein
MSEAVTWGQVGTFLGIGLLVVVILWVLYRILSIYADAWKH